MAEGMARAGGEGFDGSADVSMRCARPAPHACTDCAMRQATFCGTLETRDLPRLAAIVHKMRFAPGQLLFQEGDAAPDVFNLLDGTIKLYKSLPDGRTQITGFAAAGDFLGLSTKGVRAYSAEAVTEVIVCRFRRRDLASLAHRFPGLLDRLLAIADGQLALAHDQMLLLGRKTAEEKIVGFLLGLTRRAEERGGRADMLALPMSRGDIADFLGLTVETVSRTLNALRRRGVIRLPQPRAVVIARPAALAELAEAAG